MYVKGRILEIEPQDFDSLFMVKIEEAKMEEAKTEEEPVVEPENSSCSEGTCDAN